MSVCPLVRGEKSPGEASLCWERHGAHRSHFGCAQLKFTSLQLLSLHHYQLVGQVRTKEIKQKGAPRGLIFCFSNHCPALSKVVLANI